MLLNNKLFAQSIAYSPSSNTLTAGTLFSLSPTVTGGTVATVGYTIDNSFTWTPTLTNPWGMAYHSGSIYVCDYGGNSISAYNVSTGVFSSPYSISATSQPIGITWAGGNPYILNYNKTNNGNGNNNANAYLSEYLSGGPSASTIVQGLGAATGITTDASNNIYVAEGSYNNGYHTVAQYNTSGALAFTLSGTTNPVAVAVDGSGYIYVLDNTNKTVTQYNSTGTLQAGFSITGLSNPNAIYIDGAGDIYIGDSGTGSGTGFVNVYPPSGGSTPLTSITGLTDPRGLVTDTKGYLYVSDYTNKTVKRYKPTGGYYLSGALPPGLSFSSTTGAFGGTPTASFSSTTYTITAYFSATVSKNTTETLSCPGTSTPTISYSPSINVFTTGTTIASLIPTTTQTPTTFGISPSLPANTLSFDPTTGIISGTPTATSAATLYTITATNSFGSGTTVISLAFVVDDYWTPGSGPKIWSNPNCWSTGSVPGPTDLASIGVVDYHGSDPTVSANTTAYYVTFGSAHSATLTVSSGVTFTVNKILTINNNATPSLAGSGAVNILPAATVEVDGSGVLAISSPLTFTLQSDATGCASVQEITTGSITGNVSVQRYISAKRGYRLISSPVYSGTDANNNKVFSLSYLTNNLYVTGSGGTAGNFNASGNPTLYLYDEGFVPQFSTFLNSNFIGVATLPSGNTPAYSLNTNGAGLTATYTIPVGNGVNCFFRGNLSEGSTNLTNPSYPASAATTTVSGTLNQGQVTFKDWYTPTSTTLGSSNQKFDLIGNPYASAIDLNTMQSASTTTGIYATPLSGGNGVGSFIYELIATGSAAGQYGIWTAGGTSATATNGATEYIASGQGFFVTAQGTSTLIFNESAKAGSTNGNSFGIMARRVTRAALNPVSTNPVLRLKLASDTTSTEETVIAFNPASSVNYVFNEDAPHKAGSGSVHFASRSADSVAMMINSMPLQKTQTIPLNVYTTTDGVYNIDMTQSVPLPALYDIWLMDAYKKDSLDIKNNPTYNFDVSLADINSYGANRFTLVVRQNPALMVHLLNFAASKASLGDQVTWVTENEANYTNFVVERSIDGGVTFNDLDGILSSAQSAYSYLDKTPANGANTYRLKITDLNGAVSYSSAVTIMYANTNGKIAVNALMLYPNPATSTINLSITGNQAAGTAMTATAARSAYNIEIVNNVGSVIKSEKSSSPLWQSDVSSLIPGTYFVRVIDTGNNTVVGKSTFVKL